MSYAYVSAKGRLSRDSAEWVDLDLGDVAIGVILETYYQVSIALSNSFTGLTGYLDRDGLLAQGPSTLPQTQTINEWLTALGFQTLLLSADAPSTTPTYVTYSDAFQSGFSANRSNISRHPGTSVSPDYLPDILMTKQGLDLASLSHYALVTVNGYLHRTVGSVDGLYVLNGGRTNDITKDATVGIMSFLPIGKVQQLPILPSMVHKANQQMVYADSAYITSPVSLKGKTLLLSIGGYLHCLDRAYEKVSDTLIRIDTRYLNLPQRLYQSVNYIDLSTLPIDTSAEGSERWAVSALYSDALILNYLTLPQSFLIVVDSDNWFSQHFDLEGSGVPGMYFSGHNFQYPMVGPYGKLYDYWRKQEDDTTVYSTDSMVRNNYLFETIPFMAQSNIGPEREPSRAWENGDAYLLQMGTFVD